MNDAWVSFGVVNGHIVRSFLLGGKTEEDALVP